MRRFRLVSNTPLFQLATTAGQRSVKLYVVPPKLFGGQTVLSCVCGIWYQPAEVGSADCAADEKSSAPAAIAANAGNWRSHRFAADTTAIASGRPIFAQGRFPNVSLVKPETTHPPRYVVVRAVQASGPEIRGNRVNEDVFWIQIRDTGGTVHSLDKSTLTRLDRQLDATLMPSYATRLSAAELDDLVAYLVTLRGDH